MADLSERSARIAAAETLLATAVAGRAAVRELAHRGLPFRSALKVELSAVHHVGAVVVAPLSLVGRPSATRATGRHARTGAGPVRLPHPAPPEPEEHSESLPVIDPRRQVAGLEAALMELEEGPTTNVEPASAPDLGLIGSRWDAAPAEEQPDRGFTPDPGLTEATEVGGYLSAPPEDLAPADETEGLPEAGPDEASFGGPRLARRLGRGARIADPSGPVEPVQTAPDDEEATAALDAQAAANVQLSAEDLADPGLGADVVFGDDAPRPLPEEEPDVDVGGVHQRPDPLALAAAIAAASAFDDDYGSDEEDDSEPLAALDEHDSIEPARSPEAVEPLPKPPSFDDAPGFDPPRLDAAPDMGVAGDDESTVMADAPGNVYDPYASDAAPYDPYASQGGGLSSGSGAELSFDRFGSDEGDLPRSETDDTLGGGDMLTVPDLSAEGQPAAAERGPVLGAPRAAGPASVGVSGVGVARVGVGNVGVAMPTLGAPKIVDPASPAPTGRGVAAIQILGEGIARPVAQTLELGEATTDQFDPYDGNDFLAEDATRPTGLSLAFEEAEADDPINPEEPSAPVLTADEEIRVTAGVITADGLMAREAEKVGDLNLTDNEQLKFFKLAQGAESKGDLSTAEMHYSDLLSMSPRHVDALLGRGRSRLDMGDYAAAMSDFHKAEDLAPERPEPIVEMGNLFFARKDYSKAIHYYDHAIEVSPTHAMAWCRRGICHHYRRNHKQAFEDLQKAMSLDSEIPNVRKYVQMTVKAMERKKR